MGVSPTPSSRRPWVSPSPRCPSACGACRWRGTSRATARSCAPASLGIGLQAFVAAELVRHGTECIAEFERGVIALPDVRACYHVAGRFDYLLHVAVRDLEHLGQVVKYDIAAIPGVDRVETMLVYSEVKPDAGWPVPDDGAAE